MDEFPKRGEGNTIKDSEITPEERRTNAGQNGEKKGTLSL